MSVASDRLAAVLDTVHLKKPVIPLVNNADAAFLNDVETIKASLVRQLSSPLLWEDSIKTMTAYGVDVFIEAGPGKVLSGLIKRILSGDDYSERGRSQESRTNSFTNSRLNSDPRSISMKDHINNSYGISRLREGYLSTR